MKYKCNLYWKDSSDQESKDYSLEYESAEQLSYYLRGIANQYHDTPNLCVKITNGTTGKIYYDGWLTEPTAIGFKEFLEESDV